MPGVRDKTIISAFSQVLREARTKRGYSQEQLAYEAGVDRTFISMLETGKRQPTLSVIFALAVALNQRPEEIIAATQKLSQLPR
ncbi:MAG TPA: helix-turn-helix transcriptional regulator [Nitrosomonas europaea]|uniref:helix-turn-helix transcriptional regulator n=1 Tax=Nitrosomonas europaea TaxID=915 RepID=UPI0024928A9A|nr:helix-turn-helix transcriptional regulator [Nitrosomonas europaea]MDL1867525.1 helix-turn-helix transcriptional regulator [Betaproteobacteria bacterium PRO4]HRN81299.1 helix-turn-helix transcriptional regulator [Nitrosomonas europaea]HRO55448.1 helix-turn-helix transcriptional regulator [Nitrosomonas europaea]HRQ07454.1 helix-turn-helix transcriptional regulator [Nitrosomonas europaea]HUM73393.1 helix-turn-helix transcriptional regulator [Nitrosomonas europaea]